MDDGELIPDGLTYASCSDSESDVEELSDAEVDHDIEVDPESMFDAERELVSSDGSEAIIHHNKIVHYMFVSC